MAPAPGIVPMPRAACQTTAAAGAATPVGAGGTPAPAMQYASRSKNEYS